MNLKWTVKELEQNAIFWWPSHLNDANSNISIIPKFKLLGRYVIMITTLTLVNIYIFLKSTVVSIDFKATKEKSKGQF